MRVAFKQLSAAVSLLLTAPLCAQSSHWVGTWASAQQIPETANALPSSDLEDATLREFVHVSLGGDTVRIRLSNAFGTQPLHISAAHVANGTPQFGTIAPGTDKPLFFSGARDVTIPAGADFLSDPLPFALAPLSDVAISIHIDHAPRQQTTHPGSRTTSYLVHGDATAALSLLGAAKVEHWFFLSGIEVIAPKHAAAVVIFGDSITDGHGSTTNGNDRWPDDLARIYHSSVQTRTFGVLNEGIGGNHMLTDGLGPNALARFNRDVLANSGVTTVVLLEGINDLGGLARSVEPATSAMRDDLIHQLEASFEQFATRAHANGLKVIGATILPYIGSDYYHPTPTDEDERVKLNQWIRNSGKFDAVIDFDKITADPKAPERLLSAYDSGDHLHPSPAGYNAMALAAASVLLAK